MKNLEHSYIILEMKGSNDVFRFMSLKVLLKEVQFLQLISIMFELCY